MEDTRKTLEKKMGTLQLGGKGTMRRKKKVRLISHLR